MKNNLYKRISLDGTLNVNLEGNPLVIECEGQSLKLIFTSYYGLRKFLQCYKCLAHTHFPFIEQIMGDQFRLIYYLNDVLIGESNKGLPNSLIGDYLGVKNTKFYFKNFLSYYFR